MDTFTLFSSPYNEHSSDSESDDDSFIDLRDDNRIYRIGTHLYWITLKFVGSMVTSSGQRVDESGALQKQLKETIFQMVEENCRQGAVRTQDFAIFPRMLPWPSAKKWQGQSTKMAAPLKCNSYHFRFYVQLLKPLAGEGKVDKEIRKEMGYGEAEDDNDDEGEDDEDEVEDEVPAAKKASGKRPQHKGKTAAAPPRSSTSKQAKTAVRKESKKRGREEMETETTAETAGTSQRLTRRQVSAARVTRTSKAPSVPVRSPHARRATRSSKK